VKIGSRDDALAAYEGVVADYSPVRERFGQLASGGDEASAYFKRIVATERTYNPAEEKLPAYAVAMITADGLMGRAVTAWRDIERQSSELDDSEALLAELTEVLGSSSSIGGYERLRNEVFNGRLVVLDERLGILELEDDWLTKTLPGSQRSALQSVRQRREALVRTVKQLKADAQVIDVFEDPSVTGELEGLRAAYRELRSGLSSADASSRIDLAHARLDAIEVALKDSLPRITAIEKQEVQRIKERVTFEVEEVARSREVMEETRSEAEQVSSELTRVGFAKLEAFFTGAVMEADIGIVDVYWDRKSETAEAAKSLAAERKAVLDQVEDRFVVIRQKLASDAEPSVKEKP
jgi:hypothetical protein